jgi:hypothetical protein
VPARRDLASGFVEHAKRAEHFHAHPGFGGHPTIVGPGRRHRSRFPRVPARR